tara:strand:- start:305 stop:499 length:195 start_codon:yes stop_codon:yes gene_type:complete
MSERKKDFGQDTQFYEWLRNCPLEKWRMFVVKEETQDEEKQITISFKVPKKSYIETIDYGSLLQ